MTPILGEVGQEKGLHFIFNAPDSGIVWADPGLDIYDGRDQEPATRLQPSRCK